MLDNDDRRPEFTPTHGQAELPLHAEEALQSMVEHISFARTHLTHAEVKLERFKRAIGR